LAQVGTGDLRRLLRLARAVEDVVGDLKCDAEVEPVRAESLVAARTEQACRLDQLAGLQAAALEICIDRRIGIVRLQLLHRLASREAERRVRERRHSALVPGR